MPLPDKVYDLLSQAANAVLVDSYAAYQVYYRTVYLARKKIEEMGAAAVPDLVAALDDPDDRIRALAAELLGEIGERQAIPSLRAALEGEYDASVITTMREALSRLRDPDHIAELEAEIAAPAPAIRAEAVRLLNKTRDPRVLPHLTAATSDPHPQVREAAVRALGYSQAGDPATVPYLIAGLEDDAPAVRIAAVAMLVRNRSGDPGIVPALVAAARDPEGRVRGAIIKALRELGDERAVPVLIAALGDPEARVREYAMRGLHKMTPPEALLPLIDFARQYVANGSRSWYWMVPATLGAIGDARAVPALLDIITYDDPDYRAAAFTALVEIGAPAAGNALLDLLAHADADIRGRTAFVLGKIGDARAQADLARLAANDPAPEVRQEARHAQEAIAARIAHSAEPDLLLDELANSAGQELPRLERERQIIRELGRRGDRQAVAPLCDLLADTYPSIRSTAARALGDLGDPAAIPALEDATGDPNVTVRLFARHALARLRGAQ